MTHHSPQMKAEQLEYVWGQDVWEGVPQSAEMQGSQSLPALGTGL